MVTLSKTSKNAFLIAGSVCFVVGILVMFFGENEVKPVDTSKYRITSDPVLITAPFLWYDFALSSQNGTLTNIKKLSINFTAYDVFVSNEDINVTSKLNVRYPDRTVGVIMYFPPSQGNIPHPDYYGMIKDFGTDRNFIQFQKSSDGTFYAEHTIRPYNEQKLAFVMFILLDNGNYESFENPTSLMNIEPYHVKLDAVLSRASIEQINQTNEAIKAQNKNNALILGLTIILLGWLPIDLALTSKDDDPISSDTHSRSHGQSRE